MDKDGNFLNDYDVGKQTNEQNMLLTMQTNLFNVILEKTILFLESY